MFHPKITILTVVLQPNFQVVKFHLDTHCKMNVKENSKQPRELVPFISRNMRYVWVYILHTLDPNLYRKCQRLIPTLLRPWVKISQSIKILASHLLKISVRTSTESSKAAIVSQYCADTLREVSCSKTGLILLIHLNVPLTTSDGAWSEKVVDLRFLDLKLG